MSFHTERVERFYEKIWNRHDKSWIPRLIHEDFNFRGSLGDEKRGHDGFANYLDAVHAALGDYHRQLTRHRLVDELVEIGAAHHRATGPAVVAGLEHGRVEGPGRWVRRLDADRVQRILAVFPAMSGIRQGEILLETVTQRVIVDPLRFGGRAQVKRVEFPTVVQAEFIKAPPDPAAVSTSPTVKARAPVVSSSAIV